MYHRVHCEIYILVTPTLELSRRLMSYGTKVRCPGQAPRLCLLLWRANIALHWRPLTKALAQCMQRATLLLLLLLQYSLIEQVLLTDTGVMGASRAVVLVICDKICATVYLESRSEDSVLVATELVSCLYILVTLPLR